MQKEVTFSYQHSLVPSRDIKKIEGKLNPELRRMQKASQNNYSNERAAINLCDDKELHKQIHFLVKNIKNLKPRYLVVIGIGGSNLGTLAVHQFAKGRLHNDIINEIKTLYADTVDTDEMSEIKKILEEALKKKERVVLNVISKSGTTTETIANFEVLLELLKKYDENYKDFIVVTTGKGTLLYNLAKKSDFKILTIPDKVGGRYSVLSAAGLFPLELSGINIDELLNGASAMKSRCLSKEIEKNPAALSAAIRYWHTQYAKIIQDLFMFGNDFKGIGKWYRQLFAESLGKGCDTEGKLCIGITPTYSIGSTDMHSIAQLYLGGPFDKFTTFVKVNENRFDIKTPVYKEYNSIVKNIQGKSFHDIMNAIYCGVTHAFATKKRPYTEITLPDKSAHSIGQLIQFQIMEVMYLACLLNVNPFDQPDIESYKEETRRLLAKK